MLKGLVLVLILVSRNKSTDLTSMTGLLIACLRCIVMYVNPSTFMYTSCLVHVSCS